MKTRKLGIMLIAAVLLVALAFAGVVSAAGSGTESDPYLISSTSAEGKASWNTDGVLTIASTKNNKEIVPSYYKLTEDLVLKKNTGYIYIKGTDVHLNLDNKKITKTYDATTLAPEVTATYALRITGAKISVKKADMTLSGNIGARSGKFVTISKGNVTIEDSTFDFTQIKNTEKSLIGISIAFFSSSEGGTVYLTRCTVLNGDAGSHKSQSIVIGGGEGGVVIDGNKITDVAAGTSGARESVCIRITSIKEGDENKIVIKNTELKSASENSGNVGIALDGDQGNIESDAIVDIDSVDFTFPHGGYEIWKEASKNPTTIKFTGTNSIGSRTINDANPFTVCFADPSKSAATSPVGTITFSGNNIPQTYDVYVGASEKSGSLLTGQTLQNAMLLAGETPVSSTLTVYDNTSLSSDLTIPAKVSFVVYQDVVLTVKNVSVATGGKLVLNDGGKITVAAGKSLKLTSNSKLEGRVESLDTNGKSVFSVTTSGSSIPLKGILDISNQGTFENALSALTITNGYLTPKAGSVIIFSDAIEVPNIQTLETALDKKFKKAEIGTWILIGGKGYYVCENQADPGKGTLKLLQFSADTDYLSTNSVNFGTVSTGSDPADINVYLYSTSEATIDFSQIGTFGYEVSGGISSKTKKLAPSTLGKITVKAPGTTTPGKFTGKITVRFNKNSQDVFLSSNVIEDIQPAEEEKVAKADLPVIDIMEEKTGVVIVGNAVQLTYDTETNTATLKSSDNADVSLTIEGNGVEEVMNSTGYRWVRVPEGAKITATYVGKSADVIEKKDEGSFKTSLSLKTISVDLPTLSGSFNEDVAALLESEEEVKAQVMVTAVDTEDSLESINANIDTTRENSLEIVIPKADIESVSNIEVHHVGKEITLLVLGTDYTIEETTDTYIIHINCNQGFSSYVVSEKIDQYSHGHSPSLPTDYTPSGYVEPMVQQTTTPTAQPTSTPSAPTVMPTAKPTQTQKSPAPFVGLIAGLGAAALLIRMRR